MSEDDNAPGEAYVLVARALGTIPHVLDDGDWEHIFNTYSQATDVRDKTKKAGPYSRKDVICVLAYSNGANDEDNWIGLFQMIDGLFLTIRAGCDYTGWGCQESGSSDVATTVEDARAFGLTLEERTRLDEQLTKVSS